MKFPSTIFLLSSTSTTVLSSLIPTRIAYPAAVHTVTTVLAHTAMPAAAATHTVTVGGTSLGLKYQPESIQAAVGDMVHFIFLSKNHTITQSTFTAPCVKKADGVDSGFVPSTFESAEGAPMFMYTVAGTDPTWWYCAQGPHCTAGMVFAINPTAEKTFSKFQELAKSGGSAAASPSPTTTKVAVTLSADNSGAMATKTTVPTLGLPAASGIAVGWNAGANPQACNCACLCAAQAFPNGNGIGAFGGWGGSLPAPW